MKKTFYATIQWALRIGYRAESERQVGAATSMQDCERIMKA